MFAGSMWFADIICTGSALPFRIGKKLVCVVCVLCPCKDIARSLLKTKIIRPTI
jgi:hypothetical protein